MFADIDEWFRSNLSLNFNKTYFLQFQTKIIKKKTDLNITLLNKHITNTTDI